jgi:hypothetical protein
MMVSKEGSEGGTRPRGRREVAEVEKRAEGGNAEGYGP